MAHSPKPPPPPPLAAAPLPAPSEAESEAPSPAADSAANLSALVVGTYQLFGYNATTDFAVTLDECLSSCADLPPDCGSWRRGDNVTGCAGACAPGSGRVVAPSTPAFDAAARDAFAAAMRSAVGVSQVHVLDVAPVVAKLPGGGDCSGGLTTVVGSPTNGYYGYRLVAPVTYFPCPLRQGVKVAFGIPTALPEAARVVQLVNSATSWTAANLKPPDAFESGGMLVYYLEAAGLHALVRASAAQPYGLVGGGASIVVPGAPLPNVEPPPGMTWVSPPPPPPPITPAEECPGFPGNCAAGTSGQCQDPSTLACFSAAPGGGSCWQAGARLCVPMPVPPLPNGFGGPSPPSPPPGGQNWWTSPPPPPPPALNAAQMQWHTRGRWRYGVPRVNTDISWSAAETACRGLGGHLTSIDSAEEGSFIASEVLPNYFCQSSSNRPCYSYTSEQCPQGSCNCAAYGWIGLYLNITTRRWGWSDGSPLRYAAWGCAGAPADVFTDTSGAARPYAIISNGGQLGCAGGARPAVGTASAGSWTNYGFSPNNALAFGRFMTGGAGSACDADAAIYRATDTMSPNGQQYGAQSYGAGQPCAAGATAVNSYVCKLPA